MTEDKFRVSEHMKNIADENRQRVLEYFRKNPFSNQAKCAAELGMSPVTVGRHVRSLRGQMMEEGSE